MFSQFFAAALLTLDSFKPQLSSAAAGIVTNSASAELRNIHYGQLEYLFVEDPLDVTTCVNNTAYLLLDQADSPPPKRRVTKLFKNRPALGGDTPWGVTTSELSEMRHTD